jgi:hypothetical protein
LNSFGIKILARKSFDVKRSIRPLAAMPEPSSCRRSALAPRAGAE